MWKRLACPHHVILYACTLYHIPLFYILAFSLVLFLWYNSRFYTCHILNEPIGRSGMSVLCLEDVTLLVRKRQLAAAPCYGLLLVTCWKATFTDRSSLWVVVRDLLKSKIYRSILAMGCRSWPVERQNLPIDPPYELSFVTCWKTKLTDHMHRFSWQWQFHPYLHSSEILLKVALSTINHHHLYDVYAGSVTFFKRNCIHLSSVLNKR